MREHLADYWPAYFIVSLMVLLVAVFIHFEAQERQEFMDECQEHELHYKCVAAWRAGEQHTVVMSVYTGR